MFRILAGSRRGSGLFLPPAEKTRPTSSRAREALFNRLTAQLAKRGLSWQKVTILDAFAGSGALGLEALSRGASHGYFFEKDPIIFTVLKKNIQKLALEAQGTYFAQDCLTPPEAIAPVDIVLLDPPYEQGLETLAVDALLQKHWIKEETILVLETAATSSPPSLTNFILEDSRCYGRARISLYTFDHRPAFEGKVL